MSMQICVLADSRLGSIEEWQKSIDAEGFPLRLSDDDPNRNLVARLREEETEIEYDIHDFQELKDTYKSVNFGRDWKYTIAFTWSSDFAEEIAAWMAATGYARAVDGVIFNEQEGKLFTPSEAAQIVRDIEQRQPDMETILRSVVQRLSAESPEAEAAMQAFLQRRFKKLARKPSKKSDGA
jgi:hypothetical protein